MAPWGRTGGPLNLRSLPTPTAVAGEPQDRAAQLSRGHWPLGCIIWVPTPARNSHVLSPNPTRAALWVAFSRPLAGARGQSEGLCLQFGEPHGAAPGP